MKSTEAVILKDTFHALFEWAREKNAGPGGAQLLMGREPSSFTCQLIFPKAPISQDEIEFFDREKRMFSLDGALPKSFHLLEKAETRLMRIGGDISLAKLGASGMSLQVQIPVDAADPADTSAKVRLIERELREELKST